MTKTWFIDLDGTVPKHRTNIDLEAAQNRGGDDGEELLPGVLDFFNTIHGDHIILTTARLSLHAEITERALTRLKLPWDKIIYNLGSGQRILINDIKPAISEDNLSNKNMKTAYAINVDRNKGLGHLVNYDGLC